MRDLLKAGWNGRFDNGFFIISGNILIGLLFAVTTYFMWRWEDLLTLTPIPILGTIALTYIMLRNFLSLISEFKEISVRLFHVPPRLFIITATHYVLNKQVRENIDYILRVKREMEVKSHGVSYYPKTDTYVMVWNDPQHEISHGTFGVLLDHKLRPIDMETQGLSGEMRSVGQAIGHIRNSSAEEIRQELGV
jgi:hypothetical protein